MNGISPFSTGAWMSPAWQQAFAFMHMSMEYRANQANAVNGAGSEDEGAAVGAAGAVSPTGTDMDAAVVSGSTGAVQNTSPVAEPFENPAFQTLWNGTDPREALVNAQIQGNAAQGNGTFFGSSLLGYKTPGIAPLGDEADENAGAVQASPGASNVTGETECKTCAERRYQDGSDDSGVSYQTPTKISPDKAPSAVRSHEQEHVVRERAEADREGRKVVSQSVNIHTAICPECGRVYVSGGVTRTVTADEPEKDDKNDVSGSDASGVEPTAEGEG